MPKYRPETAQIKAKQFIKDYTKVGFNQSELARRKGISHVAVNNHLKRPAVQKALQEQINQTAKKTGITLTWLLKRYKMGAEDAKTMIKHFNKIIPIDDWGTQRLYLRDIAEIMKWLKTNGHNINLQQKNFIQIYRPEAHEREVVETSAQNINE